MGWSIGYDENWKRDIGYGVPATCDHPGCGAEIDRGLSYVCASQEPFGGDGCGLYFCGKHLRYHEKLGMACERCCAVKPPFEPTSDTPEWMNWKLTDESWRQWRDENPEEVAAMMAILESETKMIIEATPTCPQPPRPDPNSKKANS